MAEQTTVSQKPAPASNGAASTLWQRSVEGRRKISEAQKAAHAKKARSTTPVSPETQKRLQDLIKGGATVKAAAQLLGMGYSTAQRYARAKTGAKNGTPATASKKASSPAASGTGVRLRPAQLRMLAKLVPKIGPTLTAQEVAKRAKCHLSSVYAYRRKMLNEATTPPPAHPGTASQSALSAIDYADLKDAYKTIWNECWAKQTEPTDGEIRFTRVWRRIR